MCDDVHTAGRVGAWAPGCYSCTVVLQSCSECCGREMAQNFEYVRTG